MHGGLIKPLEVSHLSQENIPQHIAIIMDGNGRWAKARNLERVAGHRAGAKNVRVIVEACRKLGVRYLTLYSFSTENWNRPDFEVSALMDLFKEQLAEQLDNKELAGNKIRFRVIGDKTALSSDLQFLIEKLEQSTVENTALDLILAINYGAREEIVFAAKEIAKLVAASKISPEEINEELFSSKLRTAGIPDPDLLVRTAGEMRISNFLLWQIAYSEILVVDKFWPEFDQEVLQYCVEQYQNRERRFGKISEQL